MVRRFESGDYWRKIEADEDQEVIKTKIGGRLVPEIVLEQSPEGAEKLIERIQRELDKLDNE